ncbi:SH3 domain-containing protein [Herbaspirillum sp. RTI4]|uniref:SH3 domain-containing protein n=1 Tax=Herbaspirillum sp. RTI4 TaxID=3048640 RepID=UPI002AB3D3BD|nr:SH3 domain-containing protein [Herbaspirillum sp. RTI4]MDY7577370.1 SH3 domain-containing protein [Herbaspirillum sp. RTI4]MEA9982402.1 SH3 domain-containing protein [Herbaspirillum sp. RTI4]
MKTALRLLSLLALSTGVASHAYALDFKSVGAAPAVLYDAPSEKGRRVFVAPRNMPVEVVLTYGEWSKVRDSAGSLSWVSSKALQAKRMLVVTAANAKIRTAPNDTGAVTFSADKNVLLELVEPAASGWVKIRHRDGQTGYAKASELWGD